MNKGTGIGLALLGAPVLAVIVYLALASGRQIDTNAQLEQVRHELRQERFDRDFERMNATLGVTPLTPAAPLTAREAELERQRASLEAELHAQRQKNAETLGEFESSARASAERQHAIEKLIEERTKP